MSSRKHYGLKRSSYYRRLSVIKSKHGSQPSPQSQRSYSEAISPDADSNVNYPGPSRPGQEAIVGSNNVSRESGNCVEEGSIDEIEEYDSIECDQMSTKSQQDSANSNTSGTNSSSTLELASIIQKHSISDECINDILRLVRICYLKQVPLPENLNQLNTQLGLCKLKAVYGWVCPQCQKPHSENLLNRPLKKIQCCESPKDNSSHFITLNISQILESVLPVIQSYLSTHDEFTTTQYIKSKKSEFGLGSNDITLALNTDGASIFKSSKFSAWPILATINELSCLRRKKFMLMFGMWVGSEKPDFDKFFTPIIQQLNDLSKGFAWTDDSGNQQVSKVLVTHICCDSIARSVVQGLSQFNAKFGCSYCLQNSPGHYFPYCKNRTIRTHAQHSNLLQASSTEERFGIKCTSILLQLKGIDIIQAFPVDAMHCIYLGVTKQITNCWLSSKYKNHFSKETLATIDRDLLSIKPPMRVSRTPRSLSLHSYYKAHEWSMWLLYYSPIILINHVSEEIYQHWLHLIKAVALLSRNFTENELSTSTLEVSLFSSQVSQIYGDNNCTYNVHLLSHVPEFASMYGPLYNFTLYDFENFNNILGKYVTGTQSVSSQIVKRYFRSLHLLKNNTNPQLFRLASHNLDIFGNYLFQLPFTYKPNIHEAFLLDQIHIESSSTIWYKKIKRNDGFTVHSKMYTRVKKRNNYTVQLKSSNAVLEIKSFLYCTTLRQGYALGELFTVTPEPKINLDYIYHPVYQETQVIIISDLQEVMINVTLGERKYFLQFLNNVENNRN